VYTSYCFYIQGQSKSLKITFHSRRREERNFQREF
jgi:hypothetical protein